MSNTRTWVVVGLEDLTGRIIASYYDLRRYSVIPPWEEGGTIQVYNMHPTALNFAMRDAEAIFRFMPPTARTSVAADAKGIFAESEEAYVDSKFTFAPERSGRSIDAKFGLASALAEVRADGRCVFSLTSVDRLVSSKFAFASDAEQKLADALFHFASHAERKVDAAMHFVHISDLAFIHDFLAEYIPTLRVAKSWGASTYFLRPAETAQVLFPSQNMNKVIVFMRGYITPVTITNTTTETLTDFQIPVVLNSRQLWLERKMRIDCADIRVYDSDRWTPLPFWVEKHTVNTTQTLVWVKVPTIPAQSTKQIFITYGDLQATSVANGAATFDFFDDFDAPLDTSVWYVNASNYTISDSILRINVGAIGLQNPLPFNLNSGYIVESRVSYNSNSENAYSGVLEVSSSRFTAGNNANADATILYMVNSPPGDMSVRVWVGSGATSSYNIAAGALVFTASLNTWYVLGNETTPTTAAVWRDYTRMRNYSVSWAKNIRYLSLGAFDGSATYNIKDTSYDWVRVRKFRLNPPSVTLGGESFYPYVRVLPSDTTSAIVTNQGAAPTLVVALYFA